MAHESANPPYPSKVNDRMLGVSRADRARELIGDLFCELRDRLVPTGWKPVQVRPAKSFDLAFLKRLGGDFAATCDATPAARDEVPLEIWHVTVGVSYEPLRKLSVLLGDQFRLALLHTSATDEESLKLVDEVDWNYEDDEADSEPRAPLFRVASRAEANAAADGIAHLAVGRAIPYAERRSDLDVLLREFAGAAAPTLDREPG